VKGNGRDLFIVTISVFSRATGENHENIAQDNQSWCRE
jgi:hypothetical protein